MSVLNKLMVASATIALASTVASAGLPTAGLKVRLESDNVSVDSSNKVTSWPDQSGNSHNAATPSYSGAQQPLFEASATPTGLPAISFNPNNSADNGGSDSDDTLECLDIGATSDLDMTSDDPAAGIVGGITWYLVYHTRSATDNRKPIGAGYNDINPSTTTKASQLTWSSTCGVEPTGAPTLHNTWRAQARTASGGGLWAAFPENTTNLTDFYVGGGAWDNTNDTISAILVKPDGTRGVVSTTGADAVPTLNTHTAIGRTGGASNIWSSSKANFFNGHVAAVLIYNRLLTEAEQMQVEGYLRSKYITFRADLNGDQHVDGTDIDLFIGCASGPSVPHAASITCNAADFDEDNDVDQRDFAAMQRCYTGSTVSASECE